MLIALFLLFALFPYSAGSQTSNGRVATLTNDQIRALIRQAAENDVENDKKQRNYTYIQREEEHKLNGKGELRSTESRTYEVMMLYEDQVQRLIAKDDKPLSEKDAAKEEQKIQKIIEKRKNETEDQRRKRLQTEEKNREKDRQFVREVTDAYNFQLSGVVDLEGRKAYAIDAEPSPGFEPKSKVDVRLALLKNFDVEEDMTYRDYKKFRAGTKVVPLGEVQPK